MSGKTEYPPKNPNLPELLAPAGSEEALTAAIAAGADAVYFGGANFSNRMRAKNFTDDGLTEAIRRVHQAGARAHITVNTRVRDREMDDALRLAERILGGAPETQADALIIADLGLAAEIRKRWPHAVFHASTQTSLGSAADCRALANAGFARLVLPREFSREETAALVRMFRGTLEIEMFLHGAHCVSLSGQCLMSYFCGGRSGNRGECAQPCRLPYELGAVEVAEEARTGGRSGGGKPRVKAGKPTQTPLSLADLCLAGRLTQVIETGVDSLKIEGRLKSPSYVYGVTSVYRRLLDERRDAEPEEIRALADLFSRGFTDGYFAGRPGAGSMTGKPPRGEEESGNRPAAAAIPLSTMEKEAAARIRAFEKQRESGEKQRLTASCAVRRGVPAAFALRLALNDGGTIEGRASGQVPTEAEGKPLDRESAARNLTRLGGTAFSLDPADIDFEIENGLWLPASALNDLRRRAVEDLIEKQKQNARDSGKTPENEPRADEDTEKTEKTGKNEKTAKTGFAPYAFPAKEPRKPDNRPPFSPMDRDNCTLELADADLLLGDPICDPTCDPTAAADILSRFARLYVPAEQFGKTKAALERLTEETANRALPLPLPELCAVLPPFPPIEPIETIEPIEPEERASDSPRLIRTLKDLGCRRILAHGIGAAELTGDFTVDLSFRGNVTNGAAAKVYRDAGFSEIGLSPELPSGGIRALSALCPVSCIAYGRIPVMTLARCPMKEKNGGCKGSGGRRDPWKTTFCRSSLTDRMGETFPVFGMGDCVNVVCNARPVWMGDRLDLLKGSSLRFLWTDETPEAFRSVLNRYQSGGAGEGRRIQ